MLRFSSGYVITIDKTGLACTILWIFLWNMRMRLASDNSLTLASILISFFLSTG